jgi:hypothetical protein
MGKSLEPKEREISYGSSIIVPNTRKVFLLKSEYRTIVAFFKKKLKLIQTKSMS